MPRIHRHPKGSAPSVIAAMPSSKRQRDKVMRPVFAFLYKLSSAEGVSSIDACLREALPTHSAFVYFADNGLVCRVLVASPVLVNVVSGTLQKRLGRASLHGCVVQVIHSGKESSSVDFLQSVWADWSASASAPCLGQTMQDLVRVCHGYRKAERMKKAWRKASGHRNDSPAAEAPLVQREQRSGSASHLDVATPTPLPAEPTMPEHRETAFDALQDAFLSTDLSLDLSLIHI